MSRQMRRQEARERARRDAKRPQHGGGGRSRISRTQLIIASTVAVVAVVAIIYFGNQSNAGPASTVPPGITQSGHVRGLANAPVTIDEWADFQCPACGMFARLTEPQVLTNYVATGKVKIVFHNFAFLGQESSWAAEAADCAGEQNKFFEFHDKLYASQAGENQGAFSKDKLKAMGASLGLGPSFNSCVDSGKYAQSVRDEKAQGDSLGVDATPTLFIGGKKYPSALTYDQIKQILDPLLVGR